MLPRQEWWHAFLRSRPDISILPDQASVRLFGIGIIRADGRKIHDMYLREVKSPILSSHFLHFASYRTAVRIRFQGLDSTQPGQFTEVRIILPRTGAFIAESRGRA
jgi:hypothetical protein